ncbi:MAG: lyase family protein [Sulfitobacter sp.]|nr:lyase family protein [Sulfitobacter sp.]
MAASLFDSPLYARLFEVGETGRLFTDSAAVRAMMLVEGALARAQGSLGVIPELSAAAIHRASLEIAIDPGGLATATGENGVPVPALVAAFRAEMNAPEHAQFVHWGATSQDIMDTGLMLRLRQALALAEEDLRALLRDLATQAESHARLPMVARTYGQQATPTTWGAVLAEWGAPLADALAELEMLRQGALWVSLSGAAGTSSALGPKAAETRAALATALGLTDPERSWHTDRTPILRIVDWQGRLMAALAHMGQSLLALTATEVGEVSLGASGASSTMPQKQNPVGPSALVALHHQFAGLRVALQESSAHMHQRDGAAWFTEWLVLPQLVLSLAAALHQGRKLASGLLPRPAQMEASLDSGLGLMHAEALSFALADRMPRPEAQKEAKALAHEAMRRRTGLEQLARDKHPDLPADLFDAFANSGAAEAEARAFAARVRAL